MVLLASSVLISHLFSCSFFLFNAPATTEIYTLSLHDALPICAPSRTWRRPWRAWASSTANANRSRRWYRWISRSEEHTSELQSLRHLVCRLLLEKKKKKRKKN